MKRLDGAVAIVTGAGIGQGRAVAEAYAAEGAKVVVNDLDQAVAAAAAEEIVAATAAEAIGVAGDVSDPASAQGVVDGAVAAFGGLDVLYNNAGVNFGGNGDVGVVELDLEIWAKVLAVDLTGVMLMCRAAIPAMRASGTGAIVNVSSVAASFGGSGHAYTAAKGGVISLTRAIATTYGPDIRANVICPGAIRTRMSDATLSDPARREAWRSRALVGRIGEPEDMAGLSIFLAGEESSFITGSVFTIDGGYTAH